MQLPQERLSLIKNGENTVVPKYRGRIQKIHRRYNKGCVHTVCSFSKRNGGHIFFGVKDKCTILGARPDRIDQIKKNFVTCVNNENKMYPPLYLTPIDY